MDGPSYSEDGEWVWDGYDWVPANGQVPSEMHPEMAMHDVTHAAGSPTPFQQPDVVQPQQFNQPPGFYPPQNQHFDVTQYANTCLLYTSPSPRDVEESRMPSSA